MVNGVSGAARPYLSEAPSEVSSAAAASGLAVNCRGGGMVAQPRAAPAEASSQARSFQTCLGELQRDLDGAGRLLRELSGDAELAPRQQAQAGQLARQLDGLSQALNQGNRLQLSASLVEARGI
ncbi:hypothetical protein [Chromobacterium sphagni]|uniref:Uncharacterized protein n=1 Tax=Chromobacterium sphagni TaxID=1903179 RepID=A0A1S1WUN6_9NEIS|nr:hypothetical protein [Chromobacterium sphagni]OHX10810.1 hypothetical protein BI347_20080 [Chromobacterium sphagni]OHX19696.1 hypothetical protein BI344_17220 [Chromobacterium sphagni]